MTTKRGIYVYSPGSKTETTVSIQLAVTGGSGGSGGADAATQGYAGYPGKKVTGAIEVNLTDSLYIDVGFGGGNGASGASGRGGGSAGTSGIGYQGGTGGNAGGSGSSGAGGGGGAASVVKLNNTVLVVAGGGPGGGGAGNGPPGLGTQGYQSSGYTYGGAGENKAGDGGGAGGGGGGNLGGIGGVTQGGDSGGYSGSYGASSFSSGFTETTTNNGPGSQGIVTITYNSTTGESYFAGGRTVVNPNGDGTATVTHTFDTSGTLNGKGASIAQGVTWREVLVPKVKVDNDWNEITSAYTMVNGTWKKFYPSSGTQEFTTPGVYYWNVPGGIHSVTYTIVAAGGAGGGVFAPGGGGDPNSGTGTDPGGDPSGGGECFTADTLITMYDGTRKPIKDIVAGDLVLDALTGNANKVIGVKSTDYEVGRRIFATEKGVKPFITEQHAFYNDQNELCAMSAECEYLAPWLGPVKVVNVPEIETNKKVQTVYNLMFETGNSHYANGIKVSNMVGTGNTYVLFMKGYLDKEDYLGYIYHLENTVGLNAVTQEQKARIYNIMSTLSNYVLHNDNIRSKMLARLMAWGLKNRNTLYPYINKWFKSRVRRWIFGKNI